MGDSTGTKVCPSCGATKPLTTEYWKVRRASKNGFSSSCKVCSAATNRASRERHIEKARAICREGHAKNAPERRAKQKIWRDSHREHRREKLRQWTSLNSESCRQYRIAYYEANKDSLKAKAAAYRKANPEKVNAWNRKRHAVKLDSEGFHSAEDVQRQLIAQEGRCYWCGEPLKLTGGRNEKYQVDHIFPLQPKEGKPGSNAPHNICLSCPRCNYKKQNKAPFEFIGRLF